MYDVPLVQQMHGVRADHIGVVVAGPVRGVHLVLVRAGRVPVAGRQVRAVAEVRQVVAFECHVFSWYAHAVTGTW